MDLDPALDAHLQRARDRDPDDAKRGRRRATGPDDRARRCRRDGPAPQYLRAARTVHAAMDPHARDAWLAVPAAQREPGAADGRDGGRLDDSNGGRLVRLHMQDPLHESRLAGCVRLPGGWPTGADLAGRVPVAHGDARRAIGGSRA